MIRDQLMPNSKVIGVSHAYAYRATNQPHRQLADWVFQFKFRLADRRNVSLTFRQLCHNDLIQRGEKYKHWLVPIHEIEACKSRGIPEECLSICVDEGGWLSFLNLVGQILTDRLSPLQFDTGPKESRDAQQALAALEANGWGAAGKFVVDRLIEDGIKGEALPPIDAWETFRDKPTVSGIRETRNNLLINMAKRLADIEAFLAERKSRLSQEEFVDCTKEAVDAFSEKLEARLAAIESQLRSHDTTTMAYLSVRLDGIEATLRRIVGPSAPDQPTTVAAARAKPIFRPKPQPQTQKINLETTEVHGEAIGDMAAFQDNHK